MQEREEGEGGEETECDEEKGSNNRFSALWECAQNYTGQGLVKECHSSRFDFMLFASDSNIQLYDMFYSSVELLAFECDKMDEIDCIEILSPPYYSNSNGDMIWRIPIEFLKLVGHRRINVLSFPRHLLYHYNAENIIVPRGAQFRAVSKDRSKPPVTCKLYVTFRDDWHNHDKLDVLVKQICHFQQLERVSGSVVKYQGAWPLFLTGLVITSCTPLGRELKVAVELPSSSSSMEPGEEAYTELPFAVRMIGNGVYFAQMSNLMTWNDFDQVTDVIRTVAQNMTITFEKPPSPGMRIFGVGCNVLHSDFCRNLSSIHFT